MRLDGFNKKTGLFIIIYHVLLFISLGFYLSYYTPSVSMIVASVILYFLSGLSITAGYHRYYAHTTYKTVPVVEAILLFFGSMATQASALKWAFEHRLHHAFVDTDRDPYSVKQGFWYAHILWLFKKPAPVDNKVVSDLIRNPLVMFQNKYYIWCMLGSNFLMFLFVGWLLNDYLGAFILSWWTRLFFLHHSTWCINSLAHYWGERSFSQEQSAVDNYIISLITFGEGYHNYHHTFAHDYRNGVRWYHFDPTKWLIWGLSRLGLAHGLKKVSSFQIKERLITTHKQELLEKIQTSLTTRQDELIAYVNTLSDQMITKLREARKLVEEYATSKKQEKDSDRLKALKSEIKTVKKSLQMDWKRCRELSRQLLHSSPTMA